MVDLAKLFDYETTFPLDLKHPATEEKLGIRLQIRSSASSEVKAVIRKHLDANVERSQRGKLIKGSARLRQEIEKTAACIAGWDWGSNQYNGSVPEFSFARACDILDAEDWIYSQVAEAANNLGNFTKDSPKV